MPGYIPISTVIEGAPVDDIACVVESLAEEPIVGVKATGFYDTKLDPSAGRVTVGRSYSTFELYACAIQRWLKARAELAALL